MQFTPLADFYSPELDSHYLKGLSYRVRPEDHRLAALLPAWLEQGKVRPGAPDEPDGAARSKLSGKGSVS